MIDVSRPPEYASTTFLIFGLPSVVLMTPTSSLSVLRIRPYRGRRPNLGGRQCLTITIPALQGALRLSDPQLICPAAISPAPPVRTRETSPRQGASGGSRVPLGLPRGISPSSGRVFPPR